MLLRDIISEQRLCQIVNANDWKTASKFAMKLLPIPSLKFLIIPSLFLTPTIKWLVQYQY